jgi:hypothetical protein
MKAKRSLIIVGMLVGTLGQFALGQTTSRFGITLEGGVIWQDRNDIRVPNATGTLFSLPDVIGRGTEGLFRAEADFRVAERHGFRVVYAPLEITDSGVLPRAVSFAGVGFSPGPATEAAYKFNSYRVTYRYHLYDGATWSWRIGATGFIRDARIALRQNEVYAEDTDVGFVPLVYLQGLARIGENWRFAFDIDGLAASQGRAFDIAAKLGYSVSDQVRLEFGYRTIEGGADVEQVFNFAWLNSLVGALRIDF